MPSRCHGWSLVSPNYSLLSRVHSITASTKPLKQQPHAHDQLITESFTLSLATLPHDEISSSAASPFQEDETPSPESPPNPITLLDESNNEEEEEEESANYLQRERPTRLNNFIKRRARSHPSSPSSTDHQKRSKNIIRRSGSVIRLHKSMSSRTLGELEREEVKGFVDLGFIFDEEHLSPRMISVIPGLQRLALLKNKPNSTTNLIVDHSEDITEEDDDDVEKLREEEEERCVIRPYLSEAWLIKMPDSPLLNLRVPRVSAAIHMKKHPGLWARTVASVIRQES